MSQKVLTEKTHVWVNVTMMLLAAILIRILNSICKFDKITLLTYKAEF